MKLAFSSNAFLAFPADETMRAIAEVGYRGIEILADVPHAWPAGLLPVQRKALADSLAKYDLTISNINAFMMNAVADPRQPYWHPAWTEPDPHYRAIRREHTKRALQLAADLGAPHITTEPGGPITDGRTWDQVAELFYEELMPCVELAEKLDIPILIEPEPGLLLEGFQEYLRFMERIDSAHVALNFDVGHAYCVSEEPEEWVPKMAAHTRHYHLEDIAATRVHAHLIPGHGAIDFAATLAAIQATGYDGWLTVELYPYIDSPREAASEAYSYLTKQLAALGVTAS